MEAARGPKSIQRSKKVPSRAAEAQRTPQFPQKEAGLPRKEETRYSVK